MTDSRATAPRFERLTNTLVHLDRDDVDTDQIIPARHLTVTSRAGLGRALFEAWRGTPGFGLDAPGAERAAILLAGRNFGCGSSREHAVWALGDHGFRVVISTSFADIFAANAGKNGLLTATVSQDAHDRLAALAAAEPGAEVTVDLDACRITLPDGARLPFTVDAFVRACLLDGVDALGYLLERLPAIEAWEATGELGLDTRTPVAADGDQKSA